MWIWTYKVLLHNYILIVNSIADAAKDKSQVAICRTIFSFVNLEIFICSTNVWSAIEAQLILFWMSSHKYSRYK